MTNTSECVQKNFASQEQVYSNVKSLCPAICTVNFSNINQSLVQQAVASCLASSKNIVKQEATASSVSIFILINWRSCIL